jgi:hypothetical protein
MTGPGNHSPALPDEVSSILLDALYRLAALDGLTVREVAVRCIVAGHVPTFPAYSREVVATYQTLEQAITRGTVTA